MKSYILLTAILVYLFPLNLHAQNDRIKNIELFASELFLGKNYEKVIYEIEPLILNNPSTSVINQIVGYSKIEIKDYSGGIEWLNQKIASKSYMDNLYLGKGYQGIGNDSLAILHLELAAPQDPNNNIYYIIHDIRYKQKRYADAAQAGLNAIKWKEKKSQAIGSGDYFKIAMDYYLKAAFMNNADTVGRPEMAMRADSMFAKAIEINDKWPPFYINRARANNLIDYTGKKWLGAPYYEKFLVAVEIQYAEKGQYKVDKNQLFEAYKYLGGYHLTNTNNKAKVKEYFTKAQEIKPEDMDIKTYLIEHR
jgi:tetratricopeptide (TPR) repeat protein